MILERHKNPEAVLLSIERYEQLMAAYEELEDIIAFDEAMVDPQSNIPWEQVKTDLGWE